ncbi:MAG: hypothetical protein ACLFUS_15425 [Candidatus Sumerlaeia bacterium]
MKKQMIITSLLILIVAFARGADKPMPPGETTGVIDKMLDGPLKDVEEIVFCRRGGTGWHWYETFGYLIHNPNSSKASGGPGILYAMNLRTREVRTIFEDRGGALRDPCVSWDGKKILFSYRKAGTSNFLLYEINADGTGLRQITFSDRFDDIEPVYLPNGDIMFCSSRSMRWVPCFLTQVATVFKCDGDGKNMRMISTNVEHDNTPWVMNDGRVLYTRWEYVMRGVMSFHHLWTMNPDGTSQMVFYGNSFDGTLMIDAKHIPNSEKIVAIFSPWHGGPEHNGAIAVLNPLKGPDVTKGVVDIIAPQGVEWSEPEWRKDMKQYPNQGEWRDPYALSEDCILAAIREKIVVLDGKGNYEVLFSVGDSTRMHLHEPRPLIPRSKPDVIPDRTDLSKENGAFVLQDVYFGRNMEGVERGTIKNLLIVEELPKPASFSDVAEPMIGQHNLQRILGTVPVEDDGSAHFEAPAVRSLVFLALDKDNVCVKPMRSFTTVMPGETFSCVGCHENRAQVPMQPNYMALKALQKKPAQIEPLSVDIPYGIIDWPRDIQPILDKHCVKCHNTEKFAGKTILTGDNGPLYTLSYGYIRRKNRLYNQGGSSGNVPPYGAGSANSKFIEYFQGKHHDVKVSPEEFRKIQLWTDTGGTFAGTYAALSSGVIGFYRDHKAAQPNAITPEARLKEEIALLERRCDQCHDQRGRQKKERQNLDKIQRRFFPARLLDELGTNLTHPEKSLTLLAPLARDAGGLGLCHDKENPDSGPVFASKDDPDYQKALELTRELREQFEESKRFNMPGFVPNPHYTREMIRYGVLPDDFDLSREKYFDPYLVDDQYFRAFHWKPQKP